MTQAPQHKHAHRAPQQVQKAKAVSAVEQEPAEAPARAGLTQHRAHLSAYARDYALEIQEGPAAIPLEAQRMEGRFAMADSVAVVPDNGYYMVLWEIGVTEACGRAALHLKINEGAVPLVHCIAPGYESGQQVTWLSAGDKLHLGIEAAEPARITCGGTQLTIIRLG